MYLVVGPSQVEGRRLAAVGAVLFPEMEGAGRKGRGDTWVALLSRPAARRQDHSASLGADHQRSVTGVFGCGAVTGRLLARFLVVGITLSAIGCGWRYRGGRHAPCHGLASGGEIPPARRAFAHSPCPPIGAVRS